MLDHLASQVPALHDLVSKGLLSNQFFVGTGGAMLMGGAMYALRAIPGRIWNTTVRHTTSKLTLKSNHSDHFDEIAEYLHKNRVSWYGRSFALNRKSEMQPGYGVSIARWKGGWIHVVRSLVEKGGGFYTADQLDLTFLSRRTKTITSFVHEATYKPEHDSLKIYFGAKEGWVSNSKRKRKIETVFANGDTVSEIKDRLAAFRRDEAWYEQRGIPYKFVGVLHGKPGTGKTSLIHAIASHFGYSIRFVSNLSEIAKLAELGEGSLVVIEDIDTLGKLNRDAPDKTPKKPEEMPPAATEAEREAREAERTEAETSMSMHELFNTLDGLATPHGIVVFMTTNKLGDLDPALVRPGRVDMLLHIKYLELEAMKRMFLAFFEDGETAIDAWIARNKVTYEPMSGAELQEVFLTNRTIEGALGHLTRKFASKPTEITVTEKTLEDA